MFDAPAADAPAFGTQSGMQARRAVAAVITGMQAAHIIEQLPVRGSPRALGPGAPSVEAGRDTPSTRQRVRTGHAFW
jgi:hypothetical protein